MEEEKINKEDEEGKDIPVEDNSTEEAANDMNNGEEETAAEETAIEPEKDPLDVALEEIASLKDKYLRQVAEFDNYRKRTLKERAELILNGGEKTDDPQVLREGMEIIYHKMMKTLEGLGVKPIDTNDADFNTDEHEALTMIPAPEESKKGKVIDVIQKGYKLNGTVIRFARVVVGN